ncbi:hypothetical protein PSPO01_15904 [Paraphaeosphaeria sporulosa]
MQRFGGQPTLCRTNQQAPLHHTKSVTSCSLAPACGLASIYDYVRSPQEVTYLPVCLFLNYRSCLYAVHEALFFFTIVLRLVEALCLVCCGRDTFSLPLVFIPRL